MKLLIAVLLIAFNFGMAKIVNASPLQIAVNSQDGSYSINDDTTVIHAQVAAKVNSHWLYANNYPTHLIKQIQNNNSDGFVQKWEVTHTGLKNQPDLICILRINPQLNTGDIIVNVKNTLEKPIYVQSIRVLESLKNPAISLGRNFKSIRVLSDTYSEDRPTLQIYDLNAAPKNMHRAVGSQLIYNRATHKSLFFGALTSQHFLTIMRLHYKSNLISHYEIDSTGTTEITKQFSLDKSPLKNQIELSLSVKPGDQLSSERIMFNISHDYHAQLEQYGKLVQELHHARIQAPIPMGFWSWTAFYRDINQKSLSENADWLSKNLLPFGYNFFHLDEGYQTARGDYTTPKLSTFPNIMALNKKVIDSGLRLGIWTSPFEVSDRSELYRLHKDWLVHNAKGEPIAIGHIIIDDKDQDQLFALDTTHPEAQAYLRDTYSTLVNKWGAHYIKLDFMEDSAIEGYRYQPNVSALEAQRIGIEIIRKAVGDDVLLDKDGSPILNMVGLVDTGRISVDTGHSFEKTRLSAIGIAARYYMHKHFFITDPDAFTITRYRGNNEEPLSLNAAKASLALSLVSGGMFEIGDDLTLLSKQPERLALLKNPDLIAMAKAGNVATPVDLMDYKTEDGQPSIFYSKENSVLTVFNWTNKPRTHVVMLSDLGLTSNHDLMDLSDNHKIIGRNANKINLTLVPQSVRMIKLMPNI